MKVGVLISGHHHARTVLGERGVKDILHGISTPNYKHMANIDTFFCPIGVQIRDVPLYSQSAALPVFCESPGRSLYSPWQFPVNLIASWLHTPSGCTLTPEEVLYVYTSFESSPNIHGIL